MAPAAASTLSRFFADTGFNPGSFDLIVTGDLGAIGSELLLSLLKRDGLDIKPRHADCGLLIYDRIKQDVHAGGSGCGCSAVVLCGHLLELLCGGALQLSAACHARRKNKKYAVHGNGCPALSHHSTAGRINPWHCTSYLVFHRKRRRYLMLVGYLKAFLVGGTICLIGQLLIDYTKLTPARILVSYVVIGVILGGLGLYQPLIDFAGAGATVPLTGFGSLLARGVREAIREQGFIGIFTGGLTAGAGGITAAVIAGLFVSLCFKSGDKS